MNQFSAQSGQRCPQGHFNKFGETPQKFVDVSGFALSLHILNKNIQGGYTGWSEYLTALSQNLPPLLVNYEHPSKLPEHPQSLLWTFSTLVNMVIKPLYLNVLNNKIISILLYKICKTYVKCESHLYELKHGRHATLMNTQSNSKEIMTTSFLMTE